MRTVVATWFTIIAFAVAYDIVVTSTGVLGEIEIARLISKSCLFSFVVMIACLTLTRARSVARSGGVQPRISAFLGTNLIFLGVLFLHPRTDLTIGVHLLSAVLIVIGNALALFTLFYLGRSFSIMAEARRLVSGGPYGIVRHPLYFAEQIAVVGVLIQYASLPALILVVVQFGFQIRRILNEEALLRQTFSEYSEYMLRTARLVPGIW